MMLYRFVRLDETDLVPADAIVTRVQIDENCIWIFRLLFNKALFINPNNLHFQVCEAPETEQ